MSSASENKTRRPAVSEATGEFQPQDLATNAGATGEFTPQDLAGRADAGATGEFTPEDLSNHTVDDKTVLHEGGSRPPSDKQDPTAWGATGEFKPGELSGEATVAGVVYPSNGPQRPTHGAAPTPSVGGRYEMKRFHAKGGMGEVWLAEDCDIRRPVALKKIREGHVGLKERFLLEAQITGQLEHPGVVPVHELSVDENGEPFYVMRFIHGRTLDGAVKEYHATGPTATGEGLPREVALLRLLQSFINICQTVAYAHSRGVIHRDLKPDNVMVGDYGETLLLDWGLAKVVDKKEAASVSLKGDLAEYSIVRLTISGESCETVYGAVKGTPGYVSPEAAEGFVDQIDKVSDVYLLGATLYHILTGRAPRKGKDMVAVIMEARKTQPPPPRSITPEIPKALEAICMKAMAFRKEDRYQTALALAEDMQRYLAGEPVSAYEETLLERTWRWMKRHRQAIGWSAAAFLVVLTALAGVAKWRQVEREREQERLAAAEQLRNEKERGELAQREADALQKQNEARQRLKDFRRLADEMRFYAAIPDPVAEQAPPFYDLESGEGKGRQALALARDWGLDLASLPLNEERSAVKRELYDLLLLLAQLRSRRADSLSAGGKVEERAEAGREVLALLDQTTPLQSSTVGYHRLKSKAYQLVGEADKSKQEQDLAEHPTTPPTSLDYFLQGMAYQAEANRPADAQARSEAQEETRKKLARQAIEQYRLALKVEPDHYWANMQLGISYLGIGQPAEAAEALSACVALRPNAAWGYSARGLALIAQKRFADATADLDRAIGLSPDFRLPRLNRGIALWMEQKYDEALADFDAVLQPPENQRLIEGAYYRGQVQLERGKNKEAIQAFDEVAAARRGFQSLHLFRARAFLALEQEKEALEALDAFLDDGKAYDSKSAEAHGRRGGLLRRVLIPKLGGPARARSLRLAREQLLKAVEGGSQVADFHEDLGAILEQLAQVAPAVDAYTEALNLRPDSIKVRVKRGWAYADLQPPQYDKAKDDFTRAVKQDPSHAEANAGLGYVQACRNAPGEARLAAGRALLHGAGDYLVLHNVACVYAKLAQNDKNQATEYEDLAIANLRRALELWRKGGTGPNELTLIEREPTFHRELRERPEFKELLNSQ